MKGLIGWLKEKLFGKERDEALEYSDIGNDSFHEKQLRSIQGEWKTKGIID